MATIDPRHGTPGLAVAGRDAGPTGERHGTPGLAAAGRDAGPTGEGAAAAAAGRDAGPTGDGAAGVAGSTGAGGGSASVVAASRPTIGGAGVPAGGSAPDHEHSDVNVRPIAIFVIALGFTCVVSLLLMSTLFGVFDRRATGADPAAPALGITVRDAPPDPRLQIDPVLDLTTFRAQEDARLHGYAWVDKNAGIVRIPIERAMELIAERGVPRAPATPMPATERAR